MIIRLKDKSNERENGRIIKRFALLPIKINNEIRWLETCYIRQTWWELWHECGWENTEFVTIEEYENWLVTGKLY